MMLRAARAAGPLLRLSSGGAFGERVRGGAFGERVRGGVPSSPAVFTRGFMDFFKVCALGRLPPLLSARLQLQSIRGYSHMVFSWCLLERMIRRGARRLLTTRRRRPRPRPGCKALLLPIIALM
jgi:hypothetical protein